MFRFLVGLFILFLLLSKPIAYAKGGGQGCSGHSGGHAHGGCVIS